MKISKKQQEKLKNNQIENLDSLISELYVLRAKVYLLTKRHEEDKRYINQVLESMNEQKKDFMASMNALECLDEIVIRTLNETLSKICRGRKRRRETLYKLEQIIEQAPQRRRKNENI